METLQSGLYRFHFDESTCDKGMRRLDSMVCFVHERDPYWLKKRDDSGERVAHESGDGNVWGEFYGAHDLDYCVVERMAPIPASCLEAYKAQPSDEDEDDRQNRYEQKNELIHQLLDAGEHVPSRHIDLGKNAMRGAAGLIIPGPGASYSWLCDGVSLSWRSTTGTYVPLGFQISDRLHRWGDNIYTNDGVFDVELFNNMLTEYLPGWAVDETVLEVSCESCVFLTCTRDIYASEDSFAGSDEEFIEQFGPIPPNDAINPDYDPRRWEWLKTPLSGEHESYQTDLVGTRAVLIWGNSD